MNEELFQNISASDDMFIPKMFFNGVNDLSFADTVSKLVAGVGVADEYHGCSFPSDREPDEEDYEGVKFRYEDATVIVPRPDFIKLLKEACNRYIVLRPTSAKHINEEIARLKA